MVKTTTKSTEDKDICGKWVVAIVGVVGVAGVAGVAMTVHALGISIGVEVHHC